MVWAAILSQYKGKTILWRLNSEEKTAEGSYKLTPLYSFKENRKIKVNNTNFAEKASLESIKRLSSFFFIAAKKQLEKVKK